MKSICTATQTAEMFIKVQTVSLLVETSAGINFRQPHWPKLDFGGIIFREWWNCWQNNLIFMWILTIFIYFWWKFREWPQKYEIVKVSANNETHLLHLIMWPSLKVSKNSAFSRDRPDNDVILVTWKIQLPQEYGLVTFFSGNKVPLYFSKNLVDVFCIFFQGQMPNLLN